MSLKYATPQIDRFSPQRSPVQQLLDYFLNKEVRHLRLGSSPLKVLGSPHGL